MLYKYPKLSTRLCLEKMTRLMCLTSYLLFFILLTGSSTWRPFASGIEAFPITSRSLFEDNNNNTVVNSTILCTSVPSGSFEMCGYIGYNVSINSTLYFNGTEQLLKDKYQSLIDYFITFPTFNVSTDCKYSLTNFVCSSTLQRCFSDGTEYEVCDSVCRSIFSNCFSDYNTTTESSQERDMCGKRTKPIFPVPPHCTNTLEQTQDIILLVALLVLLACLSIIIILGGIMSFCYYRRQAKREGYLPVSSSKKAPNNN